MSGTIQVTAYEIGFKFLLKVPVSNRRGNPGAGATTHSTHHLYYVSGYHADTPITIKAEASCKADSRIH